MSTMVIEMVMVDGDLYKLEAYSFEIIKHGFTHFEFTLDDVGVKFMINSSVGDSQQHVCNKAMKAITTHPC